MYVSYEKNGFKKILPRCREALKMQQHLPCTHVRKRGLTFSFWGKRFGADMGYVSQKDEIRQSLYEMKRTY